MTDLEVVVRLSVADRGRPSFGGRGGGGGEAASSPGGVMSW